MCLYAGDMNLNREDAKKGVEILIFDFLKGKKNDEIFCSPNVFTVL